MMRKTARGSVCLPSHPLVPVELFVMPVYNTNYWYFSGGGTMSKNTSITLGTHFDSFIMEQLESGRYASTSEVVRAGLRLLEGEETRLSALRNLLIEGESSGFTDYSLESLIEDLDSETP